MQESKATLFEVDVNNTQVYDGLSTETFQFGTGVNTLAVSNITGFSEYRDGDDLVIYSINGTDYARVVGAYAEGSRLDYIEYTNTPDEAPYSVLRLVSENSLVPDSGVHFFAGTSGDDIIDGGTAETISVTGYDGNDTITGSPGRDFIDGNSGDDEISGGDGHDILRGSMATTLSMVVLEMMRFTVVVEMMRLFRVAAVRSITMVVKERTHIR